MTIMRVGELDPMQTVYNASLRAALQCAPDNLRCLDAATEDFAAEVALARDTAEMRRISVVAAATIRAWNAEDVPPLTIY